MNLTQIPFQITNWELLPVSTENGVTGTAFSKILDVGKLKVGNLNIMLTHHE